ncbi:hypothetical protein [Amycolatopsis kentuckyensis]|uniref:hypothetical protein n=1 Tax=Amycolatopsis kentuckyensis TaxID=218823 RepID=UPI00356AD8A2
MLLSGVRRSEAAGVVRVAATHLGERIPLLGHLRDAIADPSESTRTCSQRRIEMCCSGAKDDLGFTGDIVTTTFRLPDPAEGNTVRKLATALTTAIAESFLHGAVAHGARGIDPVWLRRIILRITGAIFPARIRSADPPQGPAPVPPDPPLGGDDLHHLSLIALDIEDYGSRPDRIKRELRAELRRMMTAALVHAKVAPLQEPELAGDSLRYVFGPSTPKNRLIDPLIPALTRALIAYNETARPRAHLRLRVVVDSGELVRDQYGFVGSALDDAYGLLDSAVLRDHLRQSTELPLAVMISQEIYDGVVRHGSGAIDPADYCSTTVHLKHRDLAAWIHRRPGRSGPDQPTGDRPDVA